MTPRGGGDDIEEPRVRGARGFGVPAPPDLELAATIAASAEELGYPSVWTNDAPPGDGVAAAAAMLRATERIRVGIGAVPCDRRPARDVARELAAADLPLDRLVLVVGSGASSSLAAVRAAVAELRAGLGPIIALGVAAMGERMCRLGGEIADLVLLNWMSPERIRWARRQVRKGAEHRQDGLRHPEPEVASYIRVAIGQRAARCMEGEAARYAAMPQYARNFKAMGLASVGIVAPDPGQAPGLLEPYLEVLDEAVVRPIVKLPPSRSPDFEEIFETLSVLMEVASLLAPPPASAQPVSPDAETPAPASPPEV